MEPPAPPPPGDASGSQTPAAAAESSSGGTGGKQLKKREIPYTVTPTKIEDVDALSIGHFTLAKPSNVSDRHTGQDACLYILNATDKFSLRILREVNHPNILHLQGFVNSTSSSVQILVESYSYGLTSQVEALALNFDVSKEEKVKGLIRQLIEAVDELRTNGLYHGDLKLDNTYYDKGSRLIKLGNFREKEGNDVAQSQNEDWDAAGTTIEEIANILKKWNPDLELFLMEDLSHFLKNHHLAIDQVKDAALDRVYFWDKPRRTSFFVHGVLGPLRNNGFKQRVEALAFIDPDWNLDDHDGFLTAMNNYRMRQGIPLYTGGRVNYVRFVSGAYTHEAQLRSDGDIKGNVIIDTLISPRLCLELVRIARDLGLYIR